MPENMPTADLALAQRHDQPTSDIQELEKAWDVQIEE
jgi:hypothetical protein